MLKKEFKHGWVPTPNSIINHSELSFKAKGLWTYINSKPENWDFAIWRITNETKEGEKSIRSGLKELVDFGFLEYRAKHKDGRLCGQEYILKDEPDQNKSLLKQEPPKTSTTQNGGFYNNKELNKTEFINSLSTEQPEKTETLDWKSNILNHPMFERSRFIDFKDLDDKEIDYCLDLYKASLTNGRQPHFTQAVSWLKNHNRDKIKQKPSTYPTPPKKRLYEPSSKTNIDYSQGMVDGTVEEMREFFGIEN